ncbi:hypothetical protein [Streptacidiphilus sp. MAP5-3]|uniref:hypothetical protein n=1 Tax=unclassified Streptacidiphilus TaxID=2643834 RepID=UPI003512166D
MSTRLGEASGSLAGRLLGTGLAAVVAVVMWHMLAVTWDAFDAAAGIGGLQGRYTATSCESIEMGSGDNSSTAWRCVGTFRSDDGRVVRTGVTLPDSDAKVGVPTRMIDTNGEFLLPGHSTVFWQFLEVAFWWVLGFGVLAVISGIGKAGSELSGSTALVGMWNALCHGAWVVTAVLAGGGLLLALPVGIVLAIAL